MSVTIATLSAFKTTPGPKLTKFLNEIPAPSPTSQSFYYQGHCISDSKKQRDDFVKNQSNLIDKIIDNLKSCFPDGGIIGSFAILDPQNSPSPSDLRSYGSSEIDTLSVHFGESKNTDDGVELEPLLNGQELKEEWIIFKQLMSKNFNDSSIQGMAKKLLSSSEMQEQFPQMLKLLNIALTVPVSSVDCERGFSKQNLIKTKIKLN